VLINLGEAEDKRFQLFEPYRRVLKSPGASLRFIKKRFQTSEKGFGKRPVNLYLATVIDPVDVYLKLYEAVDYKQKPLSTSAEGLM